MNLSPDAIENILEDEPSIRAELIDRFGFYQFLLQECGAYFQHVVSPTQVRMRDTKTESDALDLMVDIFHRLEYCALNPRAAITWNLYNAAFLDPDDETIYRIGRDH
jgi:hypothetical protein